ncbi:MAG TPA: hypothetical protein VE959_03265 [Bryobacteraceae bacterium]|nr:hypothetical protein [Bryobacteraceae bacterium]
MEQDVKFREMALVCECGHAPVRLRSVGFTAEYELVIHWKCLVCGKRVYVVKPLADCCRECPEDEGAPPDPKADDAVFLHQMGIRFEP